MPQLSKDDLDKLLDESRIERIERWILGAIALWIAIGTLALAIMVSKM